MAKNPWQLPRGYDASTRKALAQIFAALKNARTHITPAAFEALRLGNIQAFINLVDWESIGKDIGELEPMLQDFASKTGVQLYKDGDIVADLLFDIVDQRAVIWAQNHTADLVVEIAEEMRQQIRNVMAESTQGLLTYEQAARKIRTNLSLTSRDSAAVDSYYVRQINKLVKSGMTIDKATEKANARADRYAAKLLRKRSQTIARTELANAASNGRRLGWESGVSEGYIDPASTKEWVAEPDACDICGPMDGISVPMNDEFPSGAMMPPQHPNCRCAAVLLPPEYSDEYWTAYAKQGGNVNANVTIIKAAESYKPTEGMKVAARRALRWKDEGKAKGAGTPVGWGRATDIAAGRSMSLDVVRRMFSFFSRHEKSSKGGKDFDNTSDPSNGRIMWDAWGGDAGFTWSRNIVERNRDVKKHMAGKHDQSMHGKGSQKGLPEKLPKNVSSEEFNSYLANKYDLKALESEWRDKFIDYTAKRDALFEVARQHPEYQEYREWWRQPESVIAEISALDSEWKEWEANQPHRVEAREWAEARFSLNVEGDGDSPFNLTRAKWVIDDKATLKRQRALRAGKEPSETDLEIDKMVQSGKVLRDTEVYRAAVLPPKIVNEMQSGYSFTDKGFMATDLTSENPLFYTSSEASGRKYNPAHSRVLMRSVLPAGTTAVNVGVGEILLPRNTTVTVLSRDVANDGTILLDVEYKTND